ncbi:unnamed protein product, partial [marine sediment metagenome]
FFIAVLDHAPIEKIFTLTKMKQERTDRSKA